MSDTASPRPAASGNQIICFRCTCGKQLRASGEHAGRATVCPSCGVKCRVPLVDPEPDRSNDSLDFHGLSKPNSTPASCSAASAEKPLCSVCQCAIEGGDERQDCGSCGQPFHAECWRDNLGCSTYGCQNVNYLKTGPDIRIDVPFPLLGTPNDQPPLYGVGGADDSSVAVRTLVTITLIAGLFGVVTFGTVPAIVGLFLFAGALLEVFPCPEHWVTGSIFACVVAFVIGLTSSLLLWQ